MKLSSQLSPVVKNRLRATHVAEWMIRPSAMRAGASLRDLVERGRQSAADLSVVEDDNVFLGWVRPSDAARYPRDTWDSLQVGDLVRTLSPAQMLAPDNTIDDAMRVLEGMTDPPTALPIVIGQALVGELPTRLLEEHIERMRSTMPRTHAHVRLAPDAPVLRADGTRLGRMTRIGICRRTHRVTHLVVRLDGWTQREVAIATASVAAWGPQRIQTRCTADDVAGLDEFISYVEEPAGLPAYDPYIAFFPVLPCVRRSVPDSTACVGRDTRLWNGPRSIGRWQDITLDADSGSVLSVGYVTGLLRKSEHQLPADAINDLDDDRIEVTAS